MPKRIPGKPSGINISYALKQSEAGSGESAFVSGLLKKMNDNLKPGQQTVGVDAVKKATLLQGERNKNTGKWTFRVGIDLNEGAKYDIDGSGNVDYEGGSYADIIEINPGSLKEINMFYQNLTGKQLSNTSQQEFLKSLEAKKEAGQDLTSQEAAELEKSKQFGSLINSKLKR